MYVDGSMQTSLLEEQEDTKALEINKCLFSSQTLHLQKLLWDY
jgi:hypothetical protein